MRPVDHPRIAIAGNRLDAHRGSCNGERFQRNERTQRPSALAVVPTGPESHNWLAADWNIHRSKLRFGNPRPPFCGVSGKVRLGRPIGGRWRHKLLCFSKQRLGGQGPVLSFVAPGTPSETMTLNEDSERGLNLGTGRRWAISGVGHRGHDVAYDRKPTMTADLLWKLFLCAASLAMLAQPASARLRFSFTPIEVRETLYLHGIPFTPGVLTLSGSIEDGDDQRFGNTLDDLWDQHWEIDWLDLNSPGGNVLAATAIADIVHAQWMAVTIPNGATCASACAMIFFAGGPRRIFDTGRLGVHRAALPDGSDAPLSSLFTAEKLRQFCAGPSIIAKLLATPPGGIAWIRKYDLPESGWMDCQQGPLPRRLRDQYVGPPWRRRPDRPILRR
jgi:hypothetical protein